MANCITIRGSFVGNREDMAETLAFAAEGKVKADIELQPLTAINDVFERLEHGKVAARVRARLREHLKPTPANCTNDRKVRFFVYDRRASNRQETSMTTARTNNDTSPPSQPRAPVTGAHRRTLEALFRHPLAHNLEWDDVVGLIGKIGDVHEKANSEFVFELDGKTHVMRRPHTKDLSATEVMELRHFLAQAGRSPEGPSRPAANDEVSFAHPQASLGELARPDLVAQLAVPPHHDQEERTGRQRGRCAVYRRDCRC